MASRIRCGSTCASSKNWYSGGIGDDALSDGADSASAGVALSAAAAAATAAARSARALELDAATATPPAKQNSIASSGRRPRRMASRIRCGSTCASSKNWYSRLRGGAALSDGADSAGVALSAAARSAAALSIIASAVATTAARSAAALSAAAADDDDDTTAAICPTESTANCSGLANCAGSASTAADTAMFALTLSLAAVTIAAT